MFLNPRPPSPNSAALPESHFRLAAHTESANALAEKLFHGQISQKDYDAHIYSTTIASTTHRDTSIPIIMNLDDTLSALLAYANRRFRIPLTKAQTTKLYVWASAKIVHAVGGHALPGILLLLDQDTLKTILTTMKESSPVEQLFVEFEHDMVSA